MYDDIADRCNEILSETNLKVKGERLESFIQELFESIPGIEIHARDVKNTKGSQEIDLSLWNDKHPEGLYFLEYIILVECKNWTGKAAASDIAWFETKVRDSNKSLGLFISANGISGSSRNNTAAHDTLLTAYKNKITVIIITLHEIKLLFCSADLVKLIKIKLCGLALGKVNILSV